MTDEDIQQLQDRINRYLSPLRDEKSDVTSGDAWQPMPRIGGVNLDQIVNLQSFIRKVSNKVRSVGDKVGHLVETGGQKVNQRIKYGTRVLADLVQRGGEHVDDSWHCACECYINLEIEELTEQLRIKNPDLTNEQSPRLKKEIDEIKEILYRSIGREKRK